MQEEKEGITGRIHSIESCGTVDGPGVRVVIFLQGCALRCWYCHNPDTWNTGRGSIYTPRQLMDEILKYKSFMSFSGGGVTFTGGEPLLQAEFLLEVCRLCRENGISVGIDTSGFIWNDRVREVLSCTDFVLLDIKNFDPEVYHTLTGGTLEPTLQMLDYLKEKEITTWVRYVVVPDLTDNYESIEELADYLRDYPNVVRIDLLAFHKMGEYKWRELGLRYHLEDTREPEKEVMEKIKAIFEKYGLNALYNA